MSNPKQADGKKIVVKQCFDPAIKLGTLYDSHTDQSLLLWDEKQLESKPEPRESSNFKFISDDSFESKASNLNIDASLKLSVLGGLVEVSGAAKYLKDRKSSNYKCRFTVKYWSTSRYDELTMTQLEEIQKSESVSKTSATHVVAGVMYGADAFLIFDQKLDDNDNESKVNIQGRLESLVHGLPGLCSTVRTPQGHAELKMQDSDEKFVESIECSFHGDMTLEKIPRTFQDAVELSKYLPALLKGSSVPKWMKLAPLHCTDEQKTRFQEIRVDLVSKVEKHMEKLLDYELQCNDLADTKACSSFSTLCSQLKEFKRMILSHKKDFEDKLGKLLPEIRKSGKESQLEALIQSSNASSFSHDHLSLWLEYKVQEIKILEMYLKALQEISPVLSTGDLQAIVSSIDYDQVVCFSFSVTSREDRFLKQLTSFKQSDGPDQTPPSSWTEDRKLRKDLRSQVRQFTSFAKANAENKRIKFVVAERTDKKSDGIPAILLFEDTLDRKFNPPLNPRNVKVVSDGVTDCSITVEWSRPECGSESVESYEVCYGRSSDPESEWKTEKTKGTESNMRVGGLQWDTEYLFKVRAECEVGFSQYSEISGPVQTKPHDDRLAIRLKDDCRILHPGDKNLHQPTIYKLTVHVDPKERVSSSGRVLRKVVFGNPSYGVEEKVLMIVGATGAGKTTLINGMINYILGVRWNDDFRFKLITEESSKSQAHSQTKGITVYRLRKIEHSQLTYTLTIIDTPGYADTGGLEKDSEITQHIKEFFSEGDAITHLHGVGFVGKAPDGRLSLEMRYVYKAIRGIFGNDVAKNILFLGTFGDGTVRPPMMDAIEEVGFSDYSFFKFNNSALQYPEIRSEENLNVGEDFWKMGCTNYKKFFLEFEKKERVKLDRTRQTLEARDKLKAEIKCLREQIVECLQKVEEIQNPREEESIANSSSPIQTPTEKTRDQLRKAYAKLHVSIKKATECKKELEDIALKPDAFTAVEYFQLLIDNERNLGRDRVKYLMTGIEQARLLREMWDIDDKIRAEKSELNDGWETRVQELEDVKLIKEEVDKIEKERKSNCASVTQVNGSASLPEH